MDKLIFEHKFIVQTLFEEQFSIHSYASLGENYNVLLSDDKMKEC